VSAPDLSFENLMTRLRAGDEAAAAEVFRRFTHRLIGLARARLDHLIRRKVDPEDILQSVYRTFFSRHAEGGFILDSWDSLWGMLTVITVRKCDYRRKYFRAARRDVGREITVRADADSTAPEAEALARDPTPSEAARLAETVELLMRELTGRERDMLGLSLQGYDVAEISGRVARTERTVQRVLKRVRERLEELRREPPATP
jgi:RNA polymerase sigma-70 factor, ECF subfamily